MAPVAWTVDQVLALAPDMSAARAGRALGSTRRWLTTGRRDGERPAVWGEIRGTAQEPYRVAVDATGPAFLCSCPSRKVPCKHAIGLFVVALGDGAQAIAEAEAPEWVVEWLDRRRPKEPRPTPPTASIATGPEPESLRARRREERIDGGVDDLDRWLQDFARAGLAEMAARPWSTFDQMAARLVDAQAPGLARMVRDLGGLPHTHANWPERMLIALGRLTLLLRAWRQRETLDPDLRAEVRGLLGINEAREAVLTHPAVHDVWDVAGRRLLEGERMTVQRTWLWGNTTRRWALILEFSAGGQPLDRTLLPGTRLEADLCFYSGAAPLRALVANVNGPRTITPSAALPAESLDDLGRRFAALLGRNPWVERIPAVLAEMVPVRSADDGTWRLVDADRRQVDLAGGDGWQLLAASGGRPIDVVGEWDGFRLAPLGVQTGGVVAALRDREAA